MSHQTRCDLWKHPLFSKKVLLVGGAVRDKLLGLEPKDRDWVVVGAHPEDVEQMLADGYSRVGADFPVFLHPTSGEEYALARVERKVAKGYHGFLVETDASVTIEDDLIRRDLTINSMAMGEDGKIIDPYGGRADLHNRVLRHTSPAFAEDPLRVLRLARFAARYDQFKIAQETVDLCCSLSKSGELNHLSPERVWAELEKGFSERNPNRFMQVLDQLGPRQHSEYLFGLFGGSQSPVQDRLCKALQTVPTSERCVVGVAVLAQQNLKITRFVAMPKRVSELYELVQRLAHSSLRDRNPADIHLFMKGAKATGNGGTFNDVLQAVLVLEQASVRPALRAKDLSKAKTAMLNVRACDFPNMEGAQLGAVIKAKQIDNIQQCMGTNPKVLVPAQQS